MLSMLLVGLGCVGVGWLAKKLHVEIFGQRLQDELIARIAEVDGIKAALVAKRSEETTPTGRPPKP